MNNRCRQCKRKHHTSICDSQSPTSDPSSVPNTELARPQLNTAILHSTNQTQNNLLLKTTIAEVTSQRLTTNANILFDEGAQRSFITQQLADELELRRDGSDLISLATFGSETKNMQYFETATVYVISYCGRKIPIIVLIVPTIAVPLRTYQHTAATLPYLRGLKLAHPVAADQIFNVSLFMGADHYWSFVQNRVVRGNGPTAVNSKSGYLLSGPLPVSSTADTTVNYMLNLITSPPDVHELGQFWKPESSGIIDDSDTSASKYLKYYQENYIKFEDGRYSAKLLMKADHPPLPTNYNAAKKRNENTIQRLSQDPHVFKKYCQILGDQEKRGFIKRVSGAKKNSESVHYIQHHGAKTESSTTTVCVVYDWSCRRLKDCLEK